MDVLTTLELEDWLRVSGLLSEMYTPAPQAMRVRVERGPTRTLPENFDPQVRPPSAIGEETVPRPVTPGAEVIRADISTPVWLQVEATPHLVVEGTAEAAEVAEAATAEAAEAAAGATVEAEAAMGEAVEATAS